MIDESVRAPAPYDTRPFSYNIRPRPLGRSQQRQSCNALTPATMLSGVPYALCLSPPTPGCQLLPAPPKKTGYLAGSYYIVTAEAFGLTCGCSEGPTPAPAPVSPTPVDADSPEGESGCGGTDSFAITSSQLAEFDGCYQDAAAEDGDTFFSPTGEKVDGTLAVFPSAVDEQGFDVSVMVATVGLVKSGTGKRRRHEVRLGVK